MSKGEFEWNGKELERRLKRATAEGLMRAGEKYHSACRHAVSTPNTGVRRRGKGGRFAKTLYPNPSKPGEPPRFRTGWGQEHIVVNHNPDEMWTRVGVSEEALYMIFLELGTRRVARRPWLLKTLHENAREMARLLTVGKNKG